MWPVTKPEPGLSQKLDACLSELHQPQRLVQWALACRFCVDAQLGNLLLHQSSVASLCPQVLPYMVAAAARSNHHALPALVTLSQDVLSRYIQHMHNGLFQPLQPVLDWAHTDPLAGDLVSLRLLVWEALSKVYRVLPRTYIAQILSLTPKDTDKFVTERGLVPGEVVQVPRNSKPTVHQVLERAQVQHARHQTTAQLLKTSQESMQV